MKRASLAILAACFSFVPAIGIAQDATDDQKAAVAGDPPAQPQQLTLTDVPRSTGRWQELFNGRDLKGWDSWLGYADPGLTYTRPSIAPLGKSGAHKAAFKVVREDGKPALYVRGETWGSLVNRVDLHDYHLTLEYKWGARKWAPRLDQPENNGLLYHSHGMPGAVWGTWSRAMEFEIMRRSVGMVVPVGDGVSASTNVGQDKTIIYPWRRYRDGGRAITVTGGSTAWNVEAASDAERPNGWNRLDLYVVGDKAIHVVNGVPVMMVTDLSEVGPDGTRVPLTHGKIQLQSEGAETFFRDIRVEPIRTLPRIVAQ